MAGRTARFDLNEDSILIAIETHLHDLLRVAGGFAFVPELLPASAPEICFTLLEGELKRFFIHECDRQHFTGACVLDDGGNQTIGAKFGVFQNAVHRITTPRSRR